MRGREVWGLVLLVLGLSLWLWVANWPVGNPEGPEGQDLYFHRWGFTRLSIQGLISLVGVSATGAGFILLATSLVGRMARPVPRRTVGTVVVLAGVVPGAYAAATLLWNLAAFASINEIFLEESPRGRSVAVDTFGFDPNSIPVYTEYDEDYYQRNQTAHFDRPQYVNADDCRLEDSGDLLELTCGTQAITIDPAATAVGP